MVEAEEHATFWAIEYAMRLPSPDGESRGLLCVPLPWEEGDQIGAAVMIFESRVLARAGLYHYLALIGVEKNADAPYRLLPLGVRDLTRILETRPEGGFECVAVNPILSRYFPEEDGHLVCFPTQEFIEALASRVG